MISDDLEEADISFEQRSIQRSLKPHSILIWIIDSWTFFDLSHKINTLRYENKQTNTGKWIIPEIRSHPVV